MEKKAKYIAFYRHGDETAQFYTSNAFDMNALVKALGQENISMLSVEGVIDPQWGQLYDFLTFAELEQRTDKEEIMNASNDKELEDLWDVARDLHTEHINEVDYHMSDSEREDSWLRTDDEWFDKALEEHRRSV